MFVVPAPVFETFAVLVISKAPLLFNNASFPSEFVMVPEVVNVVPLFVASRFPFSFFNVP